MTGDVVAVDGVERAGEDKELLVGPLDDVFLAVEVFACDGVDRDGADKEPPPGPVPFPPPPSPLFADPLLLALPVVVPVVTE